MRHRGIKEKTRPDPQFVYENAVCVGACPVWNVPTVVSGAGRSSGPSADPGAGPGARGAHPKHPPRRKSPPCPDGNGQDPSEMENGAQCPDPYEG